MQTPKWYSPQIRRDLVTKLYFRAKAEGMPMTRLVDRLVEAGLAGERGPSEVAPSRVAEETNTAQEPG